VDRLSLQHLVCRALFFVGLICWKIRRKLKAWKVDDRVFPRCWTSLQQLALVWSNNFWVSFAWIRENWIEKLIDAKIRSSFPEQTFPLRKLSRLTDRNDPKRRWDIFTLANLVHFCTLLSKARHQEAGVDTNLLHTWGHLINTTVPRLETRPFRGILWKQNGKVQDDTSSWV